MPNRKNSRKSDSALLRKRAKRFRHPRKADSAKRAMRQARLQSIMDREGMRYGYGS